MFGDAAAVMVLVPTIIAFVGWRQTPSAERTSGAVAAIEIGLSLALTVAIVIARYGTCSRSRTSRCSIFRSSRSRGWRSATGCAVLPSARGDRLSRHDGSCDTALADVARRSLLQTQGFLFASALMAFLLARVKPPNAGNSWRVSRAARTSTNSPDCRTASG